MPTNSVVEGAVYSSWHPHFTPQWLSEKLATYLPKRVVGVVIDPACGAGNLLSAAALRLRADKQDANELVFVGSDISIRAVRACRTNLSRLLPERNFQIEHADFLKTSVMWPERRPVSVVMNPPFRGYGGLQNRTRRRIARLLDMRGRFNLGYAFVHRAVALYQPDALVSLLPSNWIYSRRSQFRSELDALGGAWDWEDVGDTAFRGVDVHVGILIWRPKQKARKASKAKATWVGLATAGYEVRQGVATGSDASFFGVAESRVSTGRRMPAVRGRDVDRGRSSEIWVPPSSRAAVELSVFARMVGERILASLRTRTCVLSGRRRVFEYHERIPEWFSDEPKLLLPEIAVGEIRIELDDAGRKMPLHSVLAVRVPSSALGRALRQYLKGPRQQRELLSKSPRLSGGAVRLQVDAIRAAVVRWLRYRARMTRSNSRK
jgi:hypothetical protein